MNTSKCKCCKSVAAYEDLADKITFKVLIEMFSFLETEKVEEKTNFELFNLIRLTQMDLMA